MKAKLLVDVHSAPVDISNPYSISKGTILDITSWKDELSVCTVDVRVGTRLISKTCIERIVP